MEETYQLEATYGQYCTLQMVDSVSKSTVLAFKRPGFVQVGWVEEKDGTSKVYDLGADVINLRDTEHEDTDGENEGGRKELYALWQTANYYISVDLDGGRIPAKDYVIVVDKEARGLISQIE